MSPLTPPAGEPVRKAVARFLCGETWPVAPPEEKARWVEKYWRDELERADRFLALPALACTQNAQPVAPSEEDVRKAIFDPKLAGARRPDEPIYEWQARAVMALYATPIPAGGEAEIAGLRAELQEAYSLAKRMEDRGEDYRHYAEAAEARAAKAEGALRNARSWHERQQSNLASQVHRDTDAAKRSENHGTQIIALDAALARSEQPARDGGE